MIRGWSLLRTNEEITQIYERHKLTVFRVCFAFMKNQADTEDAVQDTFYKLIKSAKKFDSVEHEKAWLIKTATNLCKNFLSHWWRKRENPDNFENLKGSDDVQINEVLSAVMSLPDKFKTVVYLHYYEGYTAAEIAKTLGKPQNTVLYHLAEARKLLKLKLGDDFL
jgi:RNA polymerase sigma-70 factor (ECF subfamily)